MSGVEDAATAVDLLRREWKAYRVMAKLSQIDAGKLAGTDQRRVSAWECGGGLRATLLLAAEKQVGLWRKEFGPIVAERDLPEPRPLNLIDPNELMELMTQAQRSGNIQAVSELGEKAGAAAVLEEQYREFHLGYQQLKGKIHHGEEGNVAQEAGR